MVTRLLLQGGLYLGDDADVAHAAGDNPDGYFEHRKFLSINERILEAFGGGWDVPPEFPVAWTSNPKLDGLRNEAKALIGTFKQAPWGWKDPRTALTLDFWRDLIPDLQVVLCVRNPLDVSASLNKRGYATRAFGRNLWFRYNEDVVEGSKCIPTLCTHYGSYFYNAAKETERLFEFCGLEHDKDAIAAASALVKKDLRHASSNIMDAMVSLGLDDATILYLELCRMAGPVFNEHIEEEMKFRLSGSVDSKIGDLENELRVAGEKMFKLELFNEDLSARMAALQDRVFQFEHYRDVVRDMQAEAHELRHTVHVWKREYRLVEDDRAYQIAARERRISELEDMERVIGSSPQMVWGGRFLKLKNKVAPTGSSRYKTARFFFRGLKFLLRGRRRAVPGLPESQGLDPRADLIPGDEPALEIAVTAEAPAGHEASLEARPEYDEHSGSDLETASSAPPFLDSADEELVTEVVRSIRDLGHELVLSISHDDFATHTGGVQKVIREQCRYLVSHKLAHVHFCPAGEDRYFVSVNAKKAGSLPNEGIAKVAEGVNDLVTFVEIHHMMGMDIATVDRIRHIQQRQADHVDPRLLHRVPFLYAAQEWANLLRGAPDQQPSLHAVQVQRRPAGFLPGFPEFACQIQVLVCDAVRGSKGGMAAGLSGTP